ncbi:hypothetical protein [Brevibacterium oceani]|uniref:hypothetical protein n=1 Tax=Brevibacterium oceani TaxID=358099 RepID=UPI001B32C717|nr:hypothetical protein [Brevibacterium oceani]
MTRWRDGALGMAGVRVERRRRPDASDASGRLGEGEPFHVAEAALRIRLDRT